MMKVTGISTLKEALAQSRSRIIGANEGHTQFLSLFASQLSNHLMIVVPSHRDVSTWANFLTLHEAMFQANGVSLAILPFWSLWGADRFVNQALTKRQRLHSLSLLKDQKRKYCIVTTLQALGQSTMTLPEFTANTIKLTVGSELDQDELISKLEQSGYRSCSIVDEEGLFSVRGSILDVFSPSETYPVRVEYFGETLASLRFFDLETQKSREMVAQVELSPATETIVADNTRKQAGQRLYDYLLSLSEVPNSDRDGLMDVFLRGSHSQALDVVSPILRSESSSALEFAPNDLTLVFPKGIAACFSSYEEMIKEVSAVWQKDLETRRITMNPQSHFLSSARLEGLLNSQPTLIDVGSPVLSRGFQEATIAPPENFEGVSSSLAAAARFDQWVRAIQNLVQMDGGSVLILASSPDHEDRICTLFGHREISCSKSSDALRSFFSEKSLPPGTVSVGPGDLSTWVWLESSKTLILPEHQLFGVQPKKVRNSSGRLKNYLSSFKDLRVGDLVVHTLHGIGRYLGMITMTVANIRGDFLHLEYAGGDKIYLPVDKLNLLQRYSSGGDGESTSGLDRLGGAGWEKRRAKVKQAVKDMADKLLKLQAQRALSHIHIYSKPSDDYFKFEAEFPFDETDDQLKAIQEINSDLESSKAMDRLICGDVGFGKTEVALRAAYRAVQEGLQVLVLVPTTILCYQHFRSFSDRLVRHGARVAQLNRFVSAATAKTVLEQTASGQIDVLVGTHKILSQSLKVKRLGLLIVDEEQKFGVVHKERLKELRAGADILTLTATPIPRTMHMAMLGLRDISIIATPPHNRLSVKTYVAKFEESLIRDAIQHEISRGGQVFFVHNRVEDIQEMALFVKSLVPKAQVRFAHGQMKENDLESTIIDFLEQKFDVLVCTTIIESGVDMPNVNTLIVNNSDRFGLAQLYQMRGRVGRASFQAYAYFLTKDPGKLSDDARRRLDVLSAHQELGAGFQIASHDLEIRGAGNLLGAEQSGHAADVGLEMYTDLLSEAIAELRNQMPEKPKVDTEIKLPITAMLSNEYVPGEGQRLQLYKNLFSVDNYSDIDQLEHEIVDRFGKMPNEAQRLFIVARIKFILSQLGAHQITMNAAAGFFEVRFGSLTEKQIDKMIQEVRRSPTGYRLSPDYKLFMYWDHGKMGKSLTAAGESEMLGCLLEMLRPIAVELEIM